MNSNMSRTQIKYVSLTKLAAQIDNTQKTCIKNEFGIILITKQPRV